MSKEIHNSKTYRKIWSDAYGKIPKDINGRTYEIHHINGNHYDNRLENLKLVTIDEHYAIHYSQGDWQACQAMAKRMRLTPEENSAICSELSKKQVAEGTHPFQLKSYMLGRKGADHPRFGVSPWNKGKGYLTSGERNSFYGKKHSEETLARLRKPKSEDHKQALRKPKSNVPRFICTIDGKETTGANMAIHFKRNYPDLDWRLNSSKIR